METSGIQLTLTENNKCIDGGSKKKVLHFGGGEIAEISDNEDEICRASIDDAMTNVDEETLPWLPYLKVKAYKTGTVMLNGVDYAGESLASFFGITTPKYASEIREFERMKEEETSRNLQDEESANWLKENHSNPPITKEVVNDDKVDRY